MESLYAAIAKMAADYLTWFVKREMAMSKMIRESKTFEEKVDVIQKSELTDEEKNEKLIEEFRKHSNNVF